MACYDDGLDPRKRSDIEVVDYLSKVSYSYWFSKHIVISRYVAYMTLYMDRMMDQILPYIMYNCIKVAQIINRPSTSLDL